MPICSCIWYQACVCVCVCARECSDAEVCSCACVEAFVSVLLPFIFLSGWLNTHMPVV